MKDYEIILLLAAGGLAVWALTKRKEEQTVGACCDSFEAIRGAGSALGGKKTAVYNCQKL